VLQRSEDLATNACCASGAPPRWIADAVAGVHDDVLARFYGCGFPIPPAIEGCTVLDLGCGTGRDVYVASQLVGPDGFVHGVDMTPEQLAVARETLDWHTDAFGYEKHNVAFHQSFIEELDVLPIEPESIDVVISNCVVNLSPAKERVLAGVHRILKPGGEFFFSDILVDRRLPEDVSSDPLLHSECLGGAPCGPDFLSLARRQGFLDPRRLSSAHVLIQNPDIERRVGAARFTSETLRLFKLPNLEARCEDYGQTALYRGGITGQETLFALDDHHLFEAGRPERVCGNTAAMLEETRLERWFEVRGDRSRHFGEFPCGATLAQSQREGSVKDDAAACC
jgi:arsenite methyltransferase